MSTKKLFDAIKTISPEVYERYLRQGLDCGMADKTGVPELDAKRNELFMLNMYVHWTYIDVERIDEALGYLKTEPHDKLPQWVFDLAAEHGINFPGDSWARAKAALSEVEAEVMGELVAIDGEIVAKLTADAPHRKRPLVVESKIPSSLPAAKDVYCGGLVMVTPAPLMSGVNDEYWLFRVRLHKNQAVVGFPKFGTIGVGFEVEDDSNTNLPYSEPTLRLYDHIKHNKRYKSITRADALRAIFLVQRACHAYTVAQHMAPPAGKPAQ